jgi:hypothetical protein
VRGDQTCIWSRNGQDLTDRFPDIARAAEEQLSEGAVSRTTHTASRLAASSAQPSPS